MNNLGLAISERNEPTSFLDNCDLSFKGCDTGYLTHCIHPYPAKYIPQIPNLLIRELSQPGDTVCDVFCGSGTTLVESLLEGRHAVGVDANPLAHLISTAKTTRLREEEAKQLRNLSLQAETLARRISPKSGASLWADCPFSSQAQRPEVEAISFWFEPHVVEELAELLSWCRSPNISENARPVALTAFSSIVVSVSKQDSDTRYVRREKRIASGDTAQKFARSLSASLSAVEKFTSLVSPDLRRSIICANVLDKPAVPAFDLMICSPPYPNAYSYHLYHMTRMLWLGMDQPRFKKAEIGSHRKYSSKGANGATAATFRTEMHEVLAWIRTHLAGGGVACFVIGNSVIRGDRIDNAQIISELGTSLGYKEISRAVRSLEPTKKAFNPVIGKIKDEVILLLENQRG